MVLSRLAKFADLEVDFKSLTGTYSPKTVAPRDLPDDRTIATWFHKIPTREWQWAYSVMATYGLHRWGIAFRFILICITTGLVKTFIKEPLLPCSTGQTAPIPLKYLDGREDPPRPEGRR